jgi:triacylglycerol esterase/lipase EstA (alpha/beta hydrolase family)
MLARLQKIITLALLAAAFGWLFYFRHNSPALAVAGFFIIALGYTLFLALEYVFLYVVNRGDPAPPATLAELFSAWLGESLVAPQVFCWRQPFRSKAFPDNLEARNITQGKRGVVFVHGFFCNRGFWNPWLQRLQGSGHAFVAVNLEPLFGSIDAYIPSIDEAVRQVTQATGLTPLLVCHSMGGLAARAWLREMKAESRVHHVVTIGTPHSGTWLARFGHGTNGLQMRLASSWQSGLNHGMPEGRHALFTCWYSTADNIVFPASTATLQGADNRLIRAKAHVQMAFAPQVVSATLARL